MSNFVDSRALRSFSDQFQQTTDGWVYRRNMHEAPIPVDEDEASKFVAQFGSRYRRLIGAVVITLIAVIMLLVAIAPTLLDGPLFLILLGAVVFAIIFGLRWVWNEPARALKNRPATGDGIPRDQYARQKLKELPPSRFLVVFGTGAAFLVLGWARRGDSEPHWLFWLACGLFLVTLGLVQLVRKVLIHRTD